ncbi:hypothetical protein P691DRAFT_169755 [Macrolepiota fuliginosa MF-IS2]|uniref:Uncharacterized protein n=1 Tax=Macrolepiota fuliginosa MF-IS2 TaxID=1400762 RepID=A0A9P5XAF0_9AGAR|nr:hypothetical protein P691DRAFT_169755 [Macrolepiota fuliginosa MF-IS2]
MIHPNNFQSGGSRCCFIHPLLFLRVWFGGLSLPMDSTVAVVTRSRAQHLPGPISVLFGVFVINRLVVLLCYLYNYRIYVCFLCSKGSVMISIMSGFGNCVACIITAMTMKKPSKLPRPFGVTPSNISTSEFATLLCTTTITLAVFASY